MASMAGSEFGADVAEVPLAKAPLVKVLTQIRFPQPVDFDEAVIDAVRRELIDEYPVFREVTNQSLLIGPDGSAHQGVGERLLVADDADANWRVTLAGNFASLEASTYSSRSDFAERTSRLIAAVSKFYKPIVCDRIGVRYVNRIHDELLLSRLDQLVQPPFLGALQIPEAKGYVAHSVCDSLFSRDSYMVQARWGILPPGAAIDPLVPPPSTRYWTLDIDTFTPSPKRFDSDTVIEDFSNLARLAHALFRLAVTSEFLRTFGGSP